MTQCLAALIATTRMTNSLGARERVGQRLFLRSDFRIRTLGHLRSQR